MQATVEQWALRPIGEIIDHIIQTYHQPLLLEMRRLDQLVHELGPGLPSLRCAALCESFRELREELEQHLQKEERILFPWFRSGKGASAGAPVRVMQHEHQTSRDHLSGLRALAATCQPEERVDRAFAALSDGLAQMQTSLTEHMRLEEEVLFPRGLGRE